ncbi:MAG TPA: copper chaperone PCu(A)C [Mycobacteriales bacterium]|nr:copper chaperone PCu(A)C [Mycobacteriales bacterium]
MPAGFLAALLAGLLGVGGLVVGARDQAGSAAGSEAGGTGAAAPPVTGTTVGDLTVYAAYIRQPASPDVAAAYLSVRNDGSTPDRLSSAYCGAATTTTVHADSAAMVAGQVAPGTPLAVPAKSVASLSPAKGHIMLDKLTGTLKAGDTVSLLLRFDKAGQVLIDVPVIGITEPAPGGATS